MLRIIFNPFHVDMHAAFKRYATPLDQWVAKQTFVTDNTAVTDGSLLIEAIIMGYLNLVAMLIPHQLPILFDPCQLAAFHGHLDVLQLLFANNYRLSSVLYGNVIMGTKNTLIMDWLYCERNIPLTFETFNIFADQSIKDETVFHWLVTHHCPCSRYVFSLLEMNPTLNSSLMYKLYENIHNFQMNLLR